MTALRHRPFVLAGVAAVPTAISIYLIGTATKDYSLLGNLSRVGLLVLQPLMILLAESLDSRPAWMLQILIYGQFPIYALLLWFPKTKSQLDLVMRCIIWWHLGIAVMFSLHWLTRYS